MNDTTRVDDSMTEIALDQDLLRQILVRFDFEKASQIIAIVAKYGAPPTADELKATAEDLVRRELARGRKDGPCSGRTSMLYLLAEYKHYEGVLETIDLALVPIREHGMRPKRTYRKDVSGYLAAFGPGHSLDEDGRLIRTEKERPDAV